MLFIFHHVVPLLIIIVFVCYRGYSGPIDYPIALWTIDSGICGIDTLLKQILFEKWEPMVNTPFKTRMSLYIFFIFLACLYQTACWDFDGSRKWVWLSLVLVSYPPFQKKVFTISWANKGMQKMTDKCSRGCVHLFLCVVSASLAEMLKSVKKVYYRDVYTWLKNVSGEITICFNAEWFRIATVVSLSCWQLFVSAVKKQLSGRDQIKADGTAESHLETITNSDFIWNFFLFLSKPKVDDTSASSTFRLLRLGIIDAASSWLASLYRVAALQTIFSFCGWKITLFLSCLLYFWRAQKRGKRILVKIMVTLAMAGVCQYHPHVSFWSIILFCECLPYLIICYFLWLRDELTLFDRRHVLKCTRETLEIFFHRYLICFVLLSTQGTNILSFVLCLVTSEKRDKCAILFFLATLSSCNLIHLTLLGSLVLALQFLVLYFNVDDPKWIHFYWTKIWDDIVGFSVSVNEKGSILPLEQNEIQGIQHLVNGALNEPLQPMVSEKQVVATSTDDSGILLVHEYFG